MTKTTLKSVYMDMYWPMDAKLVSNVPLEAKRVAHPCSNRRGKKSRKRRRDVRKIMHF